MESNKKFWYTKGSGKQTVDASGKVTYAVETMKIDERALVELLKSHGFRRYNDGEEGRDDQPLVRIGVSKIIEFVNNATVKEWALEYVKRVEPGKFSDVKQAMQKRANVFTPGVMYDFLPEISYKDIGLPCNSPRETWFARKNGLVKVTASGVELVPYGREDIFLWKEQIVQREWADVTGECIFAKFVSNIAGAQLTTLGGPQGYILTEYFDPTTPKAVILNDYMTMETDMSDGRRGKTLWMWVLSSVKSGYCRIDGKVWDPYSKFRFQDADHNTKIIYVDDVAKNFQFESMFSILAAPMLNVEQKNKHPFSIPAPKFVLSTNAAIRGDSASSRARQFQLEFMPHYSADYGPDKEFGHTFVNDWDEAEMQRLDRYCFSCVQEYMRVGLKEQVWSEGLTKRVAFGNIPAVFLDWAESLAPGCKERKDYKDSFLSCPGIPNDIKKDLASNKNTFNDWMRTWAKQKRWTISEPTRGGKVFFKLEKSEELQSEEMFITPEIEVLDAQLVVAVQLQNYELAAQLRDKKKNLQNGKDDDSAAL